uniref:UDP-glucuronosyltransferase n=1 Tax=uncultured Bacillota bacterium TaxID=344338 RepID=A0A650ENE1_9FIRM|nr:UDP-glucuronosyltransferase [uncultured Firmicutes bacterium]
MKVLILSVTAGQGHNQTAKVISDYLNDIGVESSYMDTLEYINPVLAESVSKGYLLSTKSLPKLYGEVYRMAEKRDADNIANNFSKNFNVMKSKKLAAYILSEKPDVVVCTHIFAGVLLTYINRTQPLPCKTVGIVTDFTFHPYWEDSDLDYYVTASELLTHQASKKGIPEHKVKPIGIPIHPKFADRMDKHKARAVLGLPDMRTVLVMSGSMGYGKIEAEIKELDKTPMDFQIVSVCGNNEKLKRKIDKLELKKTIYNYGFKDNVDLFMDAADCIITKPGGLTTSEALAKGLPIIMTNPIPGQEDRNVEFLLNNGAAFRISSTYTIDEVIYQLFTNQMRRRLLRATVKALGKPNSTRDFAKLLFEITGQADKFPAGEEA